MKIGIIGANGKAGRLIMKEALSRGIDVTAIVRDRSKVKEEVKIIEQDIFSLTAEEIEGLDVIVNAFGALLGDEQSHVDAGQALINLVKGTDIRVIIVGGAGSLFVDDAQTMMVADVPDFPEVIKPTANGQRKNLEDLRRTTDVNWTFISPSATFDPAGPRTGSYEIGRDQLLMNAQGNSYISYADFAIAVVDEIESPKHIKARFTVVGEEQPLK